MPPTKRDKSKVNELGIEPRNLTPQQTRELFLKAKQARSSDYRVVQPNSEEELTPFGFLALDYGLRLYGMAGRGAVYHIHGDEGSGKSSLTYGINANYQRATGLPVAIYDFEKTTTSKYLRQTGVDEDMAIVRRPDSIEEAVKDAIDLMNQGVRQFTFDSIPRMQDMVDTKLIMNGEAFKVQPGTHAKAITQFYRLMLPHIARVNGRLIMVNQTRARIEMTQDAKYAAQGYDTVSNLNYILPGGKDNRFVANVMIELKLKKVWRPGKYPDEWVMEDEARNGEEYLAQEVRIRSLKNKVTGTGFRESNLWIRPGYGVDDNIQLRQYARDLDLINSHGKRWYLGKTLDTAAHVYDDKATALRALVNDPNPGHLALLRRLVIAEIEQNADYGRMSLDDDSIRYLAGEESFKTDDDVFLANVIPAGMDDLAG